MRNKLLFGFLLFFIFFSCTEQSRDTGWELKEKQNKIKAELITELNQLSEMALTDAEEAERKLGKLITKIKNRTAIMESDTELLSARNNAIKLIEFGRLLSRINNDVKNIDYTKVDESAKLIRGQREGHPNDIGTLLHYIKYFKNKLENINDLSNNEKLAKKIEVHLQNSIKKIEEKIKNLSKFSGNESLLENTEWTGIKYSFDRSKFFLEQGARNETHIKFKEGGVFECTSVMLPYMARGTYFDVSKTFRNHLEFMDIVLRGKDPMGTTYTAGEQIKKNGEYYFGTDYLSLVFHFQDDYDMIISINYNKETFQNKGMNRVVPLRDPEQYSYNLPLGESRVYVTVINSDKHCGTAQPYDSYGYSYLFNKKNLAPFSLMKSEK